MNKSHLYRLSLLILTMLISACDSQKQTTQNLLPGKDERQVRPAKLKAVGMSQSDTYLNYPATITSTELNDLSFEVSGVVKELLVVEAQQVNKGDILAKLDSRDLFAQLNSAQAQYDNTNNDLERALRLIKEDAISKSELDERRSKRDVNKASLETAQKALQDTNLIAPYSGNVAEIYISKQQAVTSGETAIKILGNGTMEASINLPASIIAIALEEHSKKDEAYLIFSFAPELKVPVNYKEATLYADSASQTYQITFTFSAPENLNILPGMNATIWFKKPNTAKNNLSNLSIPLASIAVDGEQTYVWVVNKDTMEVSKRNITIEDGVGENLHVSSGLKLGETIVISGVSSLSAGMKVRPWSK